ncbi:NlpC/P60 family protein [Streptomyces bobili]|uniref:C40 family peptidase n=1 Tax=Streptomyces bobili TaxID=67280 RepID=UPI00342F3549
MATDRTTLPTGTGSARIEDAGTPSRAEIQQRVSALYDRAETDTGTFNATRARSGGGGRRTVNSVANSGRPAADPELEAVTRQWFEMARSRVGPTTPATLPADRRPDRPALAPPPRSTPEPAADGRRELEAGGRRAPELTGRAVAALPAAPEPPPQEPRALMPAPAATPGPAPSPAPAAPQAFLRSGKEQIGRKLAVAREVLARAVPQPMPSLPAVASWPVEQTWDTGPQQVYRPETDPWAGQQTDTGSLAVTSTGPNAVLPTAGTGVPLPTPDSGAPSYDFPAPAYEFTAPYEYPAPASDFAGPTYDSPAPASDFAAPAYEFPVPTSGFAVPQPPIAAPSNAFPEPETGLLAASYGDLLAPPSGNSAPVAPPQPVYAPAAPPQPVYATLPTLQPAFTTGEFPLPALELGLPLPEFTLPTTSVPTPAPAPTPSPLGLTGHANGTGYLGKADKALAFARAQIGRPCVTGATGPESYDCSSLTQAAWRAAGVTLPRTALDQARDFTRVDLGELRPGDLVFFFDDLSHTGLCTGNGMMIHAPGPGAAIREESVHALGEGALRGAVRPA